MLGRTASRTIALATIIATGGCAGGRGEGSHTGGTGQIGGFGGSSGSSVAPVAVVPAARAVPSRAAAALERPAGGKWRAEAVPPMPRGSVVPAARVEETRAAGGDGGGGAIAGGGGGGRGGAGAIAGGGGRGGETAKPPWPAPLTAGVHGAVDLASG